MERLSLRTLSTIDSSLRPAFDPAGLGIGIVHLGLGAFARAHVAAFTQDAVARSGALGWGICGVSQRSRAVPDALAPQDGLYSVLERGGGAPGIGVLGAVRELLFAAGQPARLAARLADPEVRVVTLTVSEKGYRLDPATGRLADDADLRADAAGRPPVTVLGQLARGMQSRQRAGGGPVTVLCCDNLPRNGATVRRLVAEFCARLPPAEGSALATWVEEHVTFPDTMVDRIVPATVDADRAEAARLLGLADAAVVVAEPFRQWVVQDRFAAGRPAWELAGATFTADVGPYETIKLRVLNGSHSALAYLGGLAGEEYVADAVRRPELAGFVRALLAADVTPTLAVPEGFDLPAYQREVVDRFGNPALRYRTAQVAMDGSHKLPQRLLPTIRERLAAGAEPRHAALAVAAWMRYVTARRTDGGARLVVDDPLAARFAAVGEAAPGTVVDRMLAIREVFGGDLSCDATLRRILTEALTDLTRHGALATAAALSPSSSPAPDPR